MGTRCHRRNSDRQNRRARLLSENPALASATITRPRGDRLPISYALVGAAGDWPGNFRTSEGPSRSSLPPAQTSMRSIGPHQESPLHGPAGSDDVEAWEVTGERCTDRTTVLDHVAQVRIDFTTAWPCLRSLVALLRRGVSSPRRRRSSAAPKRTPFRGARRQIARCARRCKRRVVCRRGT
jgi:hypothetical protein